jgi:aspartyl-tRNA(Asn)/glutamyl-tRNA(Gln) amidotransferase subunit A
MAEASSNLARFDGMRYGRRAAGGELQRVYAQSRRAGFGPEVVRRILMGTFILSEGYYDQYYDKALRVKRRIKEDYERVFKIVDALLCPTTPDKAFKLGERRHDPLQMYAADVFTIPANLAGLPALQIPLGVGTDRLPVGGQLIADAFKEETILGLGHYIERNFSGLGS